jgi:TolA-binding protein
VHAKYPNNTQVRYRVAEMRFRKGETKGLAEEFAAIADAKDSPDWLRAAALLQLGRVHDVSGRRADAKKAYERVVDAYERESAAWPARVGLVTAYRASRPASTPNDQLPTHK